jgi:hypothetical protein
VWHIDAVLAPFLVVLSALPVSGGTSRLELWAGLTLDAGSNNNALAYSSPGGWIGGDLTLGAVVFGHRVKDDDAAPSLQPFLQRTARYSLQVIGGGETIQTGSIPIGPLGPPGFGTGETVGFTRSSWGRFDTSLSASGYVSWVFLGGGFDLDYRGWHYTSYSAFAALQDASEILAHPWLEVGGRWRDLLFYAGWGVWPIHEGGGMDILRFWGNAFFGAHTVIRRFVDLGVRLDVLDGGAVIEGDVTVWLRRRFALSASLNGGRGAYVDSAPVYDRAGGAAELAYWFSPRVALAVAYAPSWHRTLESNPYGFPFELYSVQHLFTVTVRGRPAIGSALRTAEYDFDEPRVTK